MNLDFAFSPASDRRGLGDNVSVHSDFVDSINDAELYQIFQAAALRSEGDGRSDKNGSELAVPSGQPALSTACPPLHVPLDSKLTFPTAGTGEGREGSSSGVQPAHVTGVTQAAQLQLVRLRIRKDPFLEPSLPDSPGASNQCLEFLQNGRFTLPRI